jgi:restriction endonuclease Mrr
MSTQLENTSITVSIEELDFMRRNAPKAFPRLITEALEAEGYKTSRVKVHQELVTLKDEYDVRIIETARRVLLAIKGVEFESKPCQGKAG